MTCPTSSGVASRHGRNRNVTQRYRCRPCNKTFSEKRWSIANMYLSKEKVLIITTLLGEGCSRFLRSNVRDVATNHLELDEIWTYVGCRQGRIWPEHEAQGFGDNYCYIALTRESRLVAAWHLGKRDALNTVLFMEKVSEAVAGNVQISSDAFSPCVGTIQELLGDRASHGLIIKVVGPDARQAAWGDPDMGRCETTYVERLNGSLRLWMKRMNRKTYAFSKKWKNLEAALALQFAHYNFCSVHGTLRVTPAMGAGLARVPWGLDDLLAAAC